MVRSPHAPRCPALRLVAIALLFGLPALQGAPALAQQHAGASDSGTLTLTSDGLATDIDPANNESEYGATVIRNVDETLVRLAGTSPTSFAPDLATSWSSNADHSVWTFKLRHGVRFHTGRCCLSADDVRYSLARSVAAGLAGSYMLGRFLTHPFQQIKVIDPYTVKFDLGSSQPVFINAVAQDFNALILDSRAVQAHAKGNDYAHPWVALHDAGTGPYMLQSWTQGQQVTLARFPGYWGGWSGPHFSRIILTEVPDATTRREELERGQAGITFDLTPQDYDALKQNPKVTVVEPYATEIIYIVMTEAGPLASPLARQALSYAFNYDALIKGIYRGYARRSYGPIPSAVRGYDPNTFHYHTDLNTARQLLQQAGVKPGTTLTYAFEDTFPYAQMGQILQAELGQLGINVKLQAMDNAGWQNVFYGTEPIARRPNLMPYSWWPDYNDPYDMASTLIASDQGPPNGNNGGLYHNKTVDSLLARMKNAGGQAIIPLTRQLQDITGRQDPPAIWAAEPAQATVLDRGLHGFISNPIEVRTFYFYAMHR